MTSAPSPASAARNGDGTGKRELLTIDLALQDGGYSGNPTMTSLIRDSHALDTILVEINPVERPSIPRTARDILNRRNEVSFNAVLLTELRMMAMLRQKANPESGEGSRRASMRIHRVTSEAMADLGYSSKLNAEWKFLTMLHGEGRHSAEAFCREHEDDLGKRSTLDLDELTDGV